ncbi:MAG: hypothetical protein WKF43_00475 [Acidimicrobiales bacterium]
MLLGDGDVHLWLADCPHDVEAERAAWDVLSLEERQRRDRLRQPRDRALRVRTRALVRQVLAGYLGTSPTEVALGSGVDGKPEVVDVARPRWPRFNVSHSGSKVLMAVSGSREVGVDIEEVRTDLDWSAVAAPDNRRSRAG